MNATTKGIAALVVALAVLGPTRAVADNPKVNSDTFNPSVHPGDILGITTAAMPKHLELSAGVWLTWNHRPLKFMDPAGGTRLLVRDQVVADVVASLALFGWLDVGVDLPIFLLNRGDVPPAGLGLSQVSGQSVGDLRLGLKASFLKNRPGGFGLALAQDLTFPTSSPNRYTGNAGVTGTTTLIGDWAGRGWRVALNVGARFRKEVAFGVRPFGHELTLGAGLQAPLVCGLLEALATVEVRTPFTRAFQDRYDASVDMMAGLRLNWRHLAVVAAAGGGALQGYGSPVPRVSLQVAWAPAVDSGCTRDRDHDGVRDALDECPDDPGLAALAGCPDRDGDGIPDRNDRCPDAAGTAAFRGCPDRDGDRFADPDDECPDAPGGPAFKGCPDRDGDGIRDRDDRCPDVKGLAVWQGCPPPEVKVQETRLELNDRVEFDVDQATLRPEAFPILDAVAKALVAHPEIKKVRIEGHTDNTASAEYNLPLSERRAQAVLKYLADHGVAATQLEAKGYGLTRPIADNATEDGRFKNRRVEFVIVER
jgi:outer membrane protein OmpA-like peptidoglycan-associated protein